MRSRRGLNASQSDSSLQFTRFPGAPQDFHEALHE